MRINRLKILSGLMILTSLFGYLEWGRNNHQFLAQAEIEVLAKLFTDPLSVWHPFIVLPMLGQFLLTFTLFQTNPSRLMTTLGIVSLGILLGFMFLIGLLGLNLRIVASTAPFIVFAIIALRLQYKK